ncbi:NAD(P)H-dependent oxidoreductase [Ideonella sp.]|uniref:NADPH-dependent FMN reductase n=1 Tax=Ideonella sp. TaxID=1929293 RepID=UPI002B493802|nr:NAD(P)H-dependent oxidoreductase [Ideonella sp.]HJV71688.1 NAD(P)H-dependent oxidoreductase [Ideonella sp.]
MSSYSIGILVGSLRKQSLNRKLANALIALAPDSLKLEIVEIGQLPHCNADDEASPPQVIGDFKRRIESLDGILFVTPEYNRGIPGFLKNAIDIASRPYGKNSWSGKPTGVVSVSPGALGAFGANHQLRQSFVFLDMPAMQQPEAYIGNAASIFDDRGRISSEPTRAFVVQYLNSFAQWVAKHASTNAA